MVIWNYTNESEEMIIGRFWKVQLKKYNGIVMITNI